MCEKDQKLMSEQLGNSRERLMLRHIARIGQFIRKLNPPTKVLMWHDMLTNVDPKLLVESK
jgi:hypothetical protein